jgi:hypothetical protein
VEYQNQNIPQETVEENNILTSPFTEEGRRGSVPDKAPGPYGFPAKFYQVFWDIIKKELLDLFTGFFEGRLPLYASILG